MEIGLQLLRVQEGSGRGRVPRSTSTFRLPKSSLYLLAYGDGPIGMRYINAIGNMPKMASAPRHRESENNIRAPPYRH
jgi:hypothetical protein